MYLIYSRIHKVKLREKLCLKKERSYRCPEFRLAVMRQNHMLKQHFTFFISSELVGCLSYHHSTHNKVSYKIALYGISVRKPCFTHVKLKGLGYIVENGTRQQKIFIHKRINLAYALAKLYNRQSMH